MRIHQITVDRQHGSAYVYFEPLKKGASKRQINLDDAVILDIGSRGEVIGLEILNPALTQMLLGTDTMRALEKAHIPVDVA